jgi:hypothetical protein
VEHKRAHDEKYKQLYEAKAQAQADKEAKEAMLLRRVVEAFQGAMFTTVFRAWRGYAQSIQRQRYREAYRTKVEELLFENEQMRGEIVSVKQRSTFITDADAKKRAMMFLQRLGHRSITMWFAMWQSFTKDSIYNRRDKVRAEWNERLASMTAERDRMLWRMEHAKKTQHDDYARIDALAEASKHREAAIPALGSGLVVALRSLEHEAFRHPALSKRNAVQTQRDLVRKLCTDYGASTAEVSFAADDEESHFEWNGGGGGGGDDESQFVVPEDSGIVGPAAAGDEGGDVEESVVQEDVAAAADAAETAREGSEGSGAVLDDGMGHAGLSAKRIQAAGSSTHAATVAPAAASTGGGGGDSRAIPAPAAAVMAAEKVDEERLPELVGTSTEGEASGRRESGVYAQAGLGEDGQPRDPANDFRLTLPAIVLPPPRLAEAQLAPARSAALAKRRSGRAGYGRRAVGASLSSVSSAGGGGGLSMVGSVEFEHARSFGTSKSSLLINEGGGGATFSPTTVPRDPRGLAQPAVVRKPVPPGGGRAGSGGKGPRAGMRLAMASGDGGIAGLVQP